MERQFDIQAAANEIAKKACERVGDFPPLSYAITPDLEEKVTMDRAIGNGRLPQLPGILRRLTEHGKSVVLGGFRYLYNQGYLPLIWPGG